MFSILRWLHHHSEGHAQFMRYCLLGAMNTALDFTIYTGLTWGWDLWVAFWNFFMYRRWAFQEKPLPIAYGISRK